MGAVLRSAWLRRIGLAAFIACGSLALSGNAVAQDRAALTRVLRTSADFRIRIQAAFALGNMGDPRAVPVLERGLRDRNPAVRAACATALGRLGSARAIPALRRARNDRSAAVRMQARTSLNSLSRVRSRRGARRRRLGRNAAGTFPSVSVVPREDQIAWPRIRHAVLLGSMENRSRGGDPALASALQQEIAHQLRLVRGVAVLPGDQELDARTRQELERREIPTVRLNAAITRIRRFHRRGEMNVRCEVALMLLDGESEAIRGELRGAATGTAPRRGRPSRQARRQQGQQLASQALSGAVRSAMSSAQTALVRAANP